MFVARLEPPVCKVLTPEGPVCYVRVSPIDNRKDSAKMSAALFLAQQVLGRPEINVTQWVAEDEEIIEGILQLELPIGLCAPTFEERWAAKE